MALKKYGWLSRLRSYLIFDPLIWLYTVVLGVISIPFGFVRDRERILHNFSAFWARLIMRTILSPVKATGLEKIDYTKPLVYAVNHASALDIPVLYACLPFQFRIVFKKELLSYPIIGWHLRRSGQVCINQQNTIASFGSVRSALKSLKQGMPLVIFPEGGRSDNGQIKSFMPGAFFLAIKAQVRHCARRSDWNLRTAPDEHLSHQVPPARNAGRRADSDRRLEGARHRSVVSKSAEGHGRAVRLTASIPAHVVPDTRQSPRVLY